MPRIGELVRRGLLAPIRAILPRNPWLRALVYLLPVVLLLALFGPAVDVVLKLIDLLVRVVEPLLQTTVGRVLLLLVVFTLGALTAVWLLRARVRDLRAEAALGRHLRATAALFGADRRPSRDLYRRVARYRGPVPDRYPHLVADANLKLARLALEAGRIDEAMGWLARTIEPGLPRELQRSLAQLRIEALRRQGGALPATLRREAEAAAARFPADHRLLGELRDLLAADGVTAAAIDVQERLLKVAPPAVRPQEHERLVELIVASGQAALQRGDGEQARRLARRLQQVDRGGAAGGILLGDVHRHTGDLRAALKAYGATRSPAGLDRIAELLQQHPGAVDVRELLACCPMQGTLLLIARELARQGDRQRAERAARVAAEALGPSPTACGVLAEVLELLGENARARLLREQTIAQLLAPGGDAGGAA